MFRTACRASRHFRIEKLKRDGAARGLSFQYTEDDRLASAGGAATGASHNFGSARNLQHQQARASIRASRRSPYRFVPKLLPRQDLTDFAHLVWPRLSDSPGQREQPGSVLNEQNGCWRVRILPVGAGARRRWWKHPLIMLGEDVSVCRERSASSFPSRRGCRRGSLPR